MQRIFENDFFFLVPIHRWFYDNEQSWKKDVLHYLVYIARKIENVSEKQYISYIIHLNCKFRV